MIYLTPELQKKLLPLFHYSLNPGGILFLGSSESVNSSTDLFTPLDTKARLFRRRESLLPAEPIAFPPSFIPAAAELPKESTILKPAANLQSLADQLLLQHYLPAGRAGQRQGGYPLHQRADRANIWNRRPARPTGIFSPWPAKGSASN